MVGHLCQDVVVEVRHVAVVGDGAAVIVLEMLLQRHSVMGDVQNSVKVVREDL